MRHLLPALCLFAAACGTTPTAETASEANVSLLGSWSIHMTPTDRVVTTIPPPCDGSMTVTQDDAAGVNGTWSCGAGAGSLGGFRVHESGGAWIGFATPSTITGAPDSWLRAWVQIASASSLNGADLTASR
jgi:hypothetical protein